MKSDIEIARETDLRKIKEVATTLGILVRKYKIMAGILPRFLSI